MTQTELEELLQLMRDGTHYVELDTMANLSSGDPAVAGENAARALESWKKGEAVVFLYSRERDAELAPSGHREWVRQDGCDRDQSIAFLRAGAKWVGLPHYKPNF